MGNEPLPPEKSVKEQIRDQKRMVDRSKRSLDREKNKLEREKKKMMAEIKKMALKGQHSGAKMMARDIVRMTTQINKLTEFSGQLTAVSMRIASISTLNELSDAMEQAGKAMTLVSSKLDTQKLNNLAKTMMKEDSKLEMKQEMMQDVLDSIGENMDDPEEQEVLYKQVLSEVGLEVNDILPGSNKNELNQPQAENQKNAVAEGGDSLDEMLKSLQK